MTTERPDLGQLIEAPEGHELVEALRDALAALIAYCERHGAPHSIGIAGGPDIHKINFADPKQYE